MAESEVVEVVGPEASATTMAEAKLVYAACAGVFKAIAEALQAVAEAS